VTPRDRLISELEEWRLHHNAHWALTLTLGMTPERAFDPDVSFKPHVRKLLKQISCEVFGVPRRQVKNLTCDAAPFFAGLYESRGKHGQPWPHLHGAIALRGQSEALLRGVLRDRWGMDEDPELPGVISADHVAVPCPSREFAPRGVVNRHDYRPSFALKRIFSANWLGGYSTKQVSTSSVSIWTAPEIMNLAA
jgi:hypothetical protein